MLDYTKFRCKKCGKELTTEEIVHIYEETSSAYMVDFKCSACGNHNREEGVYYLEEIVQMVPLCKFDSIYYQRDQECAGCEVRSYTMGYDGINGCNCMREFYKTGKCKYFLEIDLSG